MTQLESRVFARQNAGNVLFLGRPSPRSVGKIAKVDMQMETEMRIKKL